MSTNSFKTKNSLVLTPRDLTTLPTPEAGELACDINDGNKIKQYNPTTSTWDEIGSSQLQNVDALFLQDFEIDELSEFTQTGLAIVKTNPIRGKASAQLIHQAATSQSFKQILSVPLKFRGALATSSVVIQSSAPEGDVTIQFTCETTSTVLSSQSIQTDAQLVASLTTTNLSPTVSGFDNVTINSLYAGMVVTGTGIPTGTRVSAVNSSALTITLSNNATASGTVSLRFSSVPETRSFSFTIPSTCQSLSYTITALQESGFPETYIDDIFIGLNSVPLLETSVEVPNLTAWQGYVPTFQGFGTPSNIEFEWRQNGENVEIRGKFVSGTPNTSEARVGLPNAYISAGTSLIPSIQIAGTFARGATSTAKGGVVLIEPSVSYVTFSDSAVFSADTINPLTKESGQNIVAVGDTISFYVSIPCAGLSATSAKVIELTQSGIVNIPSSSYRLVAWSYKTASINTNVLYFDDGVLAENTGSAISKVSSSTLGDYFEAMEDGDYSVNFFGEFGATAMYVTLQKNSNSITNASTLATLYESGSSDLQGLSWTGPLVKGDKLYFVRSGGASSFATGGFSCVLAISKNDSNRQVTVNSDQKIEIPSSELRFEGASARGTGAEALTVQFTSLTYIRGDAFTVDNTNGTLITMKKAGIVSVSASAAASTAANTLYYIFKNNEIKVVGQAYTNTATVNVSSTFSVGVGDIVKIGMTQTPTASSNNNLNIIFQEQDISVSVTNTLPQFSESDSCVRVTTGNGFTGNVRLFSNLIQNIGDDVEYVPASGQFIVKSSGVYSVYYSEIITTASAYFAITRNSTSAAASGANLIASTTTIFTGSDFESCGNTVYLNSGDIIRAVVNNTGNAAAANTLTTFTITKIGKPNVTGVDVTPFVKINTTYEVIQSEYISISGNLTTASDLSLGTKSGVQGSGLYSLSTSGVTALKDCRITVILTATDAAGPDFARSVLYFNGTYISQNDGYRNASGGTVSSVGTSFKCKAGDFFQFSSQSNSGIASNIITIQAVRDEDSEEILTPTQTFSTDTASLQYASSALYTLNTLQNAPVGTYITFTYAASTNTRTQTTTRPTQTDADMNTNGMLIYTRAFAATSTAAQPAAFAIQIGKGFKGKSLNLYKNVSKTTSGEIGFTVSGSTGQSGLYFNSYDEKTGILYLDSGACTSGSIASNIFFYTDTTNQVSGYLVINASKNPALTGLGLGTVAARGVSTNGQTTISGTTTMFYDSAKNYDTHNALNTSTGVFTCPEDGYYQASWGLLLAAAAGWGAGERIFSYLSKNGNAHALGTYVVTEVAGTYSMGSIGSTGLYLKKDDVISILIEHNNGASINLSTGSGNNFFSVHKTSLNTGN
jgi:hypothetical protein